MNMIGIGSADYKLNVDTCICKVLYLTVDVIDMNTFYILYSS